MCFKTYLNHLKFNIGSKVLAILQDPPNMMVPQDSLLCKVVELAWRGSLALAVGVAVAVAVTVAVALSNNRFYGFWCYYPHTPSNIVISCMRDFYFIAHPVLAAGRVAY